MEDLNIKNLIQAVRQELVDSENERIQKGLNPLFHVDKLKIEVNFVVEKVKKTEGKLNLKIVDVGRDVSYSNQQIHKITLELKTTNENEPNSQDRFNSDSKVVRKRFIQGSEPKHIPGFLPTILTENEPVLAEAKLKIVDEGLAESI